MRFLWRHRVIVVLGSLVLASAIVAQLIAERTQTGPPLSSNDAGSEGALALAMWLGDLGYRVDRIEGTDTALDSVQLLFVLQPLRRFDRGEAQAIRDWVSRGGVLVYLPAIASLAGLIPSPAGDGIAEQLDLSVGFGPSVEAASAAFPYFTTPPASRFSVQTARALEEGPRDWLPLVRGRDRTVVATRQIGSGRVYALTSSALLSNQGIGRLENSALILNILARHPNVKRIAFEEAHHAVLESPTLAQVYRTSPWGWAISYAGLIIFGFLLWGGRRFGPAVERENLLRRSAGDYVVSFAGLLQRARATAWAQEHYLRMTQRRLARNLGVRTDLPARELSHLLAQRRTIDAEALAEHLEVLEGPPLAERALLRQVREVEAILQPGER